MHIYQSGFRAIHSTDTCLSWLTYVNLHDAKNGKHTGMILIDLQKAFDTLWNTILLDKMKCIGFQIKQKSSFIFTSQTNRDFFLSWDYVVSEAGTINCGVPQGSILGPLLLLLYINDIPPALSDSHT